MIKDGVMMSQAEFRAQVIGECIEALPRESSEPSDFGHGLDTGIERCRAELEALVTKPDRANELAGEWITSAGGDMDSGAARNAEDFARWLLDNNHISGEGK